MQIFIKLLSGATRTINVEPSDTIEKIKQTIAHLPTQPPQPIPSKQRLIYSGHQLEDGRSLTEYNIPKCATLHMVLRLRGMISGFREPNQQDAKETWLRNIDILPQDTPALNKDEMLSLMEKTNASQTKTFAFYDSGETLLTKQLRRLCMRFMDVAHQSRAPDAPDCKMVLDGQDAFRALFGAGTDRLYEELISYHHDLCNHGVKIALRRTTPTDGIIGWHTDGGYATQTVQYTLNENYVGGNLCFYTKNGPFHQKRREGTLTVHNREILHAVTKLHSGTRYALFVVDYTNGLGEKDVYTFNAEDIRNLMTPVVKQEEPRAQAVGKDMEPNNNNNEANTVKEGVVLNGSPEHVSKKKNPKKKYKKVLQNKTYQNDQGYFVTKSEYVEVTDDEAEDAEQTKKRNRGDEDEVEDVTESMRKRLKEEKRQKEVNTVILDQDKEDQDEEKFTTTGKALI